MYPFLEPLGQALSPGPFKYSCISALITTYLTFSVHSPHWFSLPTSLVMVLPIWSQVLLFSPVLIPFTVLSPLLTSSLPTLPHIHFSNWSVWNSLNLPWTHQHLVSNARNQPTAGLSGARSGGQAALGSMTVTKIPSVLTEHGSLGIFCFSDGLASTSHLSKLCSDVSPIQLSSCSLAKISSSCSSLFIMVCSPLCYHSNQVFMLH